MFHFKTLLLACVVLFTQIGCNSEPKLTIGTVVNVNSGFYKGCRGFIVDAVNIPFHEMLYEAVLICESLPFQTKGIVQESRISVLDN